MVEQNEFLDVILTGDTSQFRRPLEEDIPTTPPPTMVGLSGVVQTKNTRVGPPPLPVEGISMKASSFLKLKLTLRMSGPGSGEITVEDAAPDSKIEGSQVNRRRLGVCFHDCT